MTLLGEHDQWWAVIKNLRAGVMPPQGESRPSAQEQARIREWVKTDVFGTDPNNPDPGRVTLRRLNRAEYQNTIRDLMGVDFKAEVEFPPDDTGYGFDNNGDVLSISPLLLEKYMQAADTIVSRAVPTAAKVVGRQSASGSEFRSEDGSANGDRMTFYEPANVSHVFEAKQDGDYRLALEVHADGNFDYDPGRCKVTFIVDGQTRLEKEYVWKEGTTFHYELAEEWEAGDHRLTFELLVRPTRDRGNLPCLDPKRSLAHGSDVERIGEILSLDLGLAEEERIKGDDAVSLREVRRHLVDGGLAALFGEDEYGRQRGFRGQLNSRHCEGANA